MLIKKEKNLLKFYMEDGNRVYVLDINKGIFYNDKTRKQLKAYPAHFKNELELATRNKKAIPATANLLYTLIHRGAWDFSPNNISPFVLTRYSELFSVVDKLDSARIPQIKDVRDIGFDYRDNMKSLLFINNHFSQFIKWYHEKGKAIEQDCLDVIHCFPKEYLELSLVKEYPQLEHLTNTQEGQELICELVSAINHFGWAKKEIRYVVYYLLKNNFGMYEILNFHIGSAFNSMDRYFIMRKALGLDYDKNDFGRIYVETLKAYELNKRKQANLILRIVQSDTLSYANDNYIAIVPKTVEEFVQEGTAQHNCVGGYIDLVTEKSKNVVFIRRKEEPDTSFVTCDISLPINNINQFLLAYNTDITESSLSEEEKKALLNFKEEYQYYLWNLRQEEE